MNKRQIAKARRKGSINQKVTPGLLPGDAFERAHIKILVNNATHTVTIGKMIVEMAPESIYQFELYQPEHLRCDEELQEWTYFPVNLEELLDKRRLKTRAKRLPPKFKQEDDET